MKKILLLACAVGAFAPVASAIATNYALELTAAGSVQCGAVSAMEETASYTVQLWMSPAVWNNGAQILSLGNDCKLTLGAPGQVEFTVGSDKAEITSADLAEGKWAQLTILCDNGSASALVNGVECYTGTLGKIAAGSTNLVLGAGFEGRLDDVRLWNDVLSGDFNYFIKNTINRWNPQLDALVAYYKFDQADCPDIVEQTAVWNETDGYNNHGKMSATGVSRSVVTDNPAMKYRLNGAYTANERFYDRAIPRDQYLLSNDLIILGIQSFADGHLEYSTPCNHATADGAQWLAEYEGRTGVMSFDGTGTVNCGTELLNISDNIYSFEAFIYVDEWVEGATIFSKTTSDGMGLSLTLGEEENHVMTVSVDGHKYSLAKRIGTGEWYHIGFNPNSGHAGNSRYTFNYYVNGTKYTSRPSDVDPVVYQTPTMDANTPMVLGKDFKGKMDNVAFWKYSGLTDGDMKSHMSNGMPMPGLDKVLTSAVMQKAGACYLFDRSDNPGYDSYSQDSWLEIMREAYAGHDGYEIRISVKTPSGYNDSNLINLINNQQWRTRFAEDLAKLVGPYDGAELDLEWVYNWTGYGLLAKEIREKLPADKSFMVSTHNVSYKFPLDKMEYVDGFTFQQYGPQKQHFYYSHFESMTNEFMNYGYPTDKIVCSYATTTSRGYKDGNMATAIRGVRDGFMDSEDFVSDEEVDVVDFSGNTYYYTGPLQTYKRARFVVENDIRGIFYWDMGNDVPVEHKYNLAKWCSYALNSNVEPHVTSVNVSHSSGLEDVTADRASASITRRGNVLTGEGMIDVFGVDGRKVCCGAGSVNVGSLAPGVYVARSAGATFKFEK
ncbi:MAG: hypothetical protein K2M12_07790 [Muribaculaceae bacterium]|nr:hypothetical protein [Muribaculaceae bacterium]